MEFVDGPVERLVVIDDPLNPDIKFHILIGPGYQRWYRVTYVGGEAMTWTIS